MSSEPQAPQSSTSTPSLWASLRTALTGELPDIADGDLRRIIPLLALPMALETAMEALFAIVDMLLVSRLGPHAIAAVGLTESIMALIYAVAFGLAAPATAMVARRIGEGNRLLAAEAGHQALWLAITCGALTATPALFARPVLKALGAEPAVVELGVPFMVLSLCTGPILTALFVLGGVSRGAGNAAAAMQALWLANGINLALDPCLIFGLGPFPAWGVVGAATATSVGRTAGALYLMLRLRSGPLALPLAPRLHPRIARQLLGLSLGSTAQHLVETGSWVLLVRILNVFGSTAVAGYTIAIRIVVFTLLPAWGFSNATATIVGQSLGARNPGRAAQAVYLSGLYASLFLGVVAAAFLLIPGPIIACFTTDPQVSAVGIQGIRIIGYGYLFYGWQMVCLQAFNGAGDTRTPALLNIGCFWVVQVPLAYVLALHTQLGSAGVFAAVTTSYSLAAVIGMALLKRGTWHNIAL